MAGQRGQHIVSQSGGRGKKKVPFPDPQQDSLWQGRMGKSAHAPVTAPGLGSCVCTTRTTSARSYAVLTNKL